MTYNFYQLIQENTVSIPLIQRDYAQGRHSEVMLRNSFIDKLKTVLESKAEKLNLDFVYGYTENGINKTSVFVPLDGQQRLTTLWLLHWYFASKENRITNGSSESNSSKECKKILKSFTYETRISSKRFCESLVNNPFNNLNDIEVLSDEIKDASWFMASWNYYPTIVSMLNMLNTIHEKMNSQDNIWEKLVNDSKITFDYLDIRSEEFKLTDELYIKMNSRGKPLTDFENFKAQFSGLLSSNFKSETIDFNGKKITFQQYFAFKIDSVWMDLFWSYRSRIEAETKIDESILNLVYFLAEFLYYKDKDNQLDFERNFNSLSKIFSKKENILLLFNSLDFLHSIGDLDKFFNDIFSNLNLFENYSKNLFLRAISDSNFNIKIKTLFYAILSFCIKTKINTPNTKLKHFTRICRNLLLSVRQINALKRIEYTSDLRIQGVSDYGNFIDAFVALVHENKDTDVYSIFAENSFSGFTKEVLLAEKAKAQIIVSKPSTRLYIHQLEDNEAIQGNTSNFRLSSSDLITKIIAFCEIWDEKTDNSLIVRAFLTIGDYSVETHNNSTLGKIRYFGSPKYWNRILTAPDKKIASNLDKFLLSYSTALGNSSNQKLNDLVNDFHSETKDWKYYFITYDSITRNYQRSLNLFNLFTWGCAQGFDINSLGNSGKQPLLSYHLNPYLTCVKNHFGRNNKKVELVKNRFTDWSYLKINSEITIFCLSTCWQISLFSKGKLSEHLTGKFQLTSNADNTYFLRSTIERDNIEILIDFINDFLEE